MTPMAAKGYPGIAATWAARGRSRLGASTNSGELDLLAAWRQEEVGRPVLVDRAGAEQASAEWPPLPSLFKAIAILALAATGWSQAASAHPATPVTRAGLPPSASRGAGAAVAFDEMEAENAVTDGVVIGPDRRFTTIAAEASGRRAVRLERRGQHVEFTLARPANAVTIRTAIPDGPDGRGLDATLSLSANGRPAGRLAVTSRYGWFYGAYPFTNRPGDGRAHHFFDESRLLFGRVLPAGTRVRVEIAAGDRAPWYVVDLADFELVPPPRRRPEGALSVTTFGADPSGRRSSTAAFARAIAAAQRRGRTLWIPPGMFRVDGHLTVDRVRIEGAGTWHSVVRGRGVGFYGRSAPRPSTAVTLAHFAILGEVTERVDDAQLNAIGGATGGGSVIRDLWIQHHKVGLWFDGPMRGIRISRLRILDCAADGLNFRRGVSDAVVEDSFIRNSGDDGLAAWSHHDADHDIAFRRNTVIAPVLANGIAIYGGRDVEVSGNLIADTLTEGGGLHLGNRFDAVPAAGLILFRDNVVVRAGSFDPRWRFGVGALWFYALDAAIDADVQAVGNVLIDSSEEAVQFLGKPISTVTIDRLTIEGAHGAALQIQAAGAAMLRDGRVRGVSGPGVLRCHADFTLKVSGTPGLGPERTELCPG